MLQRQCRRDMDTGGILYSQHLQIQVTSPSGLGLSGLGGEVGLRRGSQGCEVRLLPLTFSCDGL